jgi:hypothetical protein
MLKKNNGKEVKSSNSNPLFDLWPERKEAFMDIKEKEIQMIIVN